MNSLLLLVIALVALGCGYRFYGTWLSRKWGVDNNKETPAHTMEDGIDYVPAKAPVLMGHHFCPSPAQAPSPAPSALQRSDGCPARSGSSSEAFSSAVSMTTAHYLLPYVTVENPSVRSFPQICPREQRASSSFSRT